MALLWGAAACGVPRVPLQPEFAPKVQSVFQPPVPVVETPDDDLLPAVMSDGTRLVYAAKGARDLDIFVKNGDGSTERLTSHSADDTDPTISPDGKLIAWVSQADDVKGDIWLMDSDGGNKRRLTDRTTADRAPAFAPSGRTIYFTALVPGSLVERIDSIELDTGLRRTVIEKGWDPAPSPDGKTLFYAATGDGNRARLFARRLEDGRVLAITDGAYLEGLPRAVRVGDGVEVLFARFVDDQDANGSADADDPASLWAVSFSEGVMGGAPPGTPRPLTSGARGEIFAAAAGDWFVYTSGRAGELDLYALPLSGMIAPEVTAQAVLEAARAQDDPAWRRLALRYVVATAPDLVAQARYELGRELSERDKLADAIDELGRAAAAAKQGELAGVARIEIERLRMLQRLSSRLVARESAERAFVDDRRAAVESLARAYPASSTVRARARTFAAEALLALGHRDEAVRALQALANEPGVPPEDGARALDRLGELFERVADLDAVAQLSERVLSTFGAERYYSVRAAQRWVETSRNTVGVPALAALEEIVRKHSNLSAVAARASLAMASLQATSGHDKVALERWRALVAAYPGEREAVTEALLNAASAAERLGDSESAITAYERLLSDFGDDSKVRRQARAGLVAIALRKAVLEEKAHEPAKARESYLRLLRSDRELVTAHRRYIALSAGLGRIDEALSTYGDEAREHPRDKIARYGFGYALTFKQPIDLDAAEREIEAALEIDPRFAAAHLTRGWIREQKERSAPNRGYLEAAEESYETARQLADPVSDTDIWAAASLNKGNALFALGKTDQAFAAYLDRELSGAPHSDPVTEVLFRESFARVALREDANDVALDMAKAANALSRTLPGEPRRAASTSLLAAIYLLIGNYEDALAWYNEAEQLYAKKGDSVRRLALLRGRALALQALQRPEEALTAMAAILDIVATDAGPEEPKTGFMLGVPLGFVSEIPADAKNVTRAVYGFSGQQEEEIARAAAARACRQRGDLAAAREFDKRRLQLVRKAAANSRQGPRIAPELVAALNESALLAVQAGQPGEASTKWAEAIEVAGKQSLWREAAVMLNSIMTLWSRFPASREAKQQDKAIEVAMAGVAALQATKEPPLAALQRFLALCHFSAATRAPSPQTAGSLSALFDALDQSLAHADSALGFATDSGDQALAAHIAHYSGKAVAAAAPQGEATPSPSPAAKDAAAVAYAATAKDATVTAAAVADAATAKDATVAAAAAPPATPAAAQAAAATLPPFVSWQRAFDQAIGAAKPATVSGPDPLDAAIASFEAEPTPAWVPERGAFLELAVEKILAGGDTERAWRLLERDRLLDLRVGSQRVTRAPLASQWEAVQKARGNPTRYQELLAGASALLLALEGRPAAMSRLREGLRDAAFLQLFAPTSTRWHAFVLRGDKLDHVAITPMTAGELPQDVCALLLAGTPPSRVVVDSGGLVEMSAFSLTCAGQQLGALAWVSEALSGTYHLASIEQRNLSRHGALVIGGSGRGESDSVSLSEEQAVKERLLEVGSSRRLVEVSLPATSLGTEMVRAGELQVVFTTRSERLTTRPLDLNVIASLDLRANLAFLPHASGSARSNRAMAQAFLLAGVPSVIVGSTQGDSAELRQRILQSASTKSAGETFTEIVRTNPNTSVLRLFGDFGLDAPGRVDFAFDELMRLARAAAGSFKAAQGSQSPSGWREAKQAFLSFLDTVAFLREPQSSARLAASEDKKKAALVPTLAVLEAANQGHLAKVHMALKELEDAAALEELVISFYQGAGKAKEAAQNALLLGQMSSGKHPKEAAAAFRRCVAFARQAKEPLTEADCQSRLGAELRSLFLLDDAIAAYREAIRLYAEANSAKEADPHRYLGFLYESSLSNYDLALGQFEAALAVAKARGANELCPSVQQDIARIYRLRGDFERALAEVKNAEQNVAATAYQTRAEIALEAARIYWYRGNYRRALERQRECLELARRSSNNFLEIQALSLAGLIALNQGELGRALDAISDALQLSRQTGRKTEEAAQLNNLGIVLREAGKNKEAIETFRAALAIDEEFSSIEGRAYDLRNLGVVLARQGENGKALEALNEALKLSRSIGNRYNELQCIFAQGEVLEATGQRREASAAYDNAAKLARTISVPEVEWRSLYALGRVAEAESDLANARSLLDRALEVAERLGRGRSESMSGRGRDDLYEDAIRLAASSQDLAAAFHYSERSRARNLLDLLATRSIDLPDEQAKALVARELSTREAWLQAQRESQAAVDEGSDALLKAKQAHDEALFELAKRYPGLARTFTITPVGLGALQAALPPETLVLSYFVGRSTTSVLAIEAGTVTSHTLKVSRDELTRTARELRDRMESFAPVEASLAALSARLFDDGIKAALARSKSLVVLPQGPLYHVPFAALPLGDDVLVAKMPVSESPSGSALLDQLARPRPQRPATIAALAPATDLPFAHLEARAVGGSSALLGADATESRLATLKADALDVAGHAELDPLDPLGSALILSPAGDSDGRLEVRELFKLSSLPSLVALSACDSAGSDVRGNEWVSLGNAFLAAGARTVIATRQRVSDLAAAILVKRFFRLAAKKPAGEALREAVLWTRRSFPHPSHWASFVLIGDFR